MQQMVTPLSAVEFAGDTIRDLLRARLPNHALPAGLYTRNDVLDADLDVIFHRNWIAVAVEADVPEPGDVYALTIGRSPIVIVRDDDGEVRAFHNVCSHRGAKLVDDGRSIVGKLVCPYHQWTYELTGELIRAPHMGQDFAKQLYHLKTVALRNVSGVIFVCLSDDPPQDMDEKAALIAERLDEFRLADTKIAHERDIVENGNWKLTMENNRECYHCASNHPELSMAFYASDFGFDPADQSEEEAAETEALDVVYADRIAEWDSCGMLHDALNFASGHETHFRTQRLIIGGNGESQTPDQRAASRIPLGITEGRKNGDVHLWSNNLWAHFMGDHAVVFFCVPLTPDTTLVRTKWLVHKDAVEGVDYDLEHLTHIWITTNQEDADLVERTHKGVQSAGYRPGPYSTFNETTVNDFVTWYVERMVAAGHAD